MFGAQTKRPPARGQHFQLRRPPKKIPDGRTRFHQRFDVIDHEACQRAEDAGLLCVMDACPKIEFPGLGLRRAG